MRHIQEASERELFGLYLDLENYIDELIDSGAPDVPGTVGA